MKKFAVFDIDGTLYRYALHHAVIDEMLLTHFSKNDVKSIENKRADWKNRIHDDAFWDFVMSQNEPFFEMLQGLNPITFESIAQKVVSEQKNHVYKYTENLLKKFKSEKRVLIAISGSASEVVKPFCQYWGFDIVVSQEFEKVNGIYTGKRQTTHDNKDVILKKLISEHSLDVNDSISVGDTFYDIPILSSTESAIAFNPDYRLQKHARSKGWDIVVERKNLILKFTQEDGQYTASEIKL